MWPWIQNDLYPSLFMSMFFVIHTITLVCHQFVIVSEFELWWEISNEMVPVQSQDWLSEELIENNHHLFMWLLIHNDLIHYHLKL